jgi:eukaryotic-like serine/threonine-protein kinase
MDALLQLKQSLSERYDIKREIGAGGMATVYLAQDLRHDRPVALKLLNPELGAILGVERFLAEIRVTANLQHPNLLPLFDSGAADGLLYYVMPFVEGESLRARLDRERQLPVDEAVRMTVAIANALDYAHSHGVIHRDLKPENILLQSGQPVIADFGIALAVKNAGGNRITQTGLSLGTPQYMSPEQATGDRVIDGRSDIYSLGALAYEMLTGEPPHTGNTAQAIIARMLTEKPRPMRVGRPAIPEHVEAAVEHALEKLPADRFLVAHQFAEALQGRSTTEHTNYSAKAQSAGRRGTGGKWRSRIRDPFMLGTSVLSAALAIALTFILLSRPASPGTGRAIRYLLAAPDSLRPIENFPWPAAISPDGSTVVYSAVASPRSLLYSLRTDELDPKPIPGTNGATQAIFSPDGQWLAFLSSGKLRKVKLDGTAPVTIGDGTANNGAYWTARDEIIIATEGGTHGLSRIDAAGGNLTQFATPDSSKGEVDYLWPVSTPDGKSVSFTIWKGTPPSSELATVSIEGGEITRLGIKGLRTLAIVGKTLVYVQSDGAVMALELDRSRRRAAGRPVAVLDPVAVTWGNNGNSGIYVSSGGGLINSLGGVKSQLSWIARDGSATPVAGESGIFGNPRISPDGNRIALNVREQDGNSVWIYDVTTRTFSRLSSIAVTASPEWSADGRTVFYIGFDGNRKTALYSQLADGGTGVTKVIDLQGRARGFAIAPDGKSVVYVTYFQNIYELRRVRLDSLSSDRPYTPDLSNGFAPQFSPDGKWVVISTEEASGTQVYVRSYPDASARVRISPVGGGEPVWSHDGKTVFYRSGTAEIAARLATTPTLRVVSQDTIISRLSAVPNLGLVRSSDVSRDGRILGLVANKSDYQLVVVPNWRAELEAKMARAARR